MLTSPAGLGVSGVLQQLPVPSCPQAEDSEDSGNAGDVA